MTTMRSFIAGTLVAVALAGAGLFLLRDADTDRSPAADGGSNVEIVDGTQIVTITAKGGYRPSKSVVQAGIPTIVRFRTKGTFDCSSIVTIPDMDVERSLPPTGDTDVPVGPLPPGTLQGSCGMGMYGFEITAK